MTIPDQLVIYCIVCVLLVVFLCCCFNVIELLKLGYLRRKLTSPHRYSLGAISTQFSDDTGTGDSRLSTRRNSAITTMDDQTQTPPTTTNNAGGGGNFSIITVFTYASTTGQSSSLEAASEQQPLAQQSYQQEESKEPLEEASSSSHTTENGTNGINERNGEGYDNRNLMDLMDDPPNYYTALCPK